MTRPQRRTSGAKDAPTRFAYPGANIRGLGRGRDAPLTGRARIVYWTVVVVLIVAVALAVVWVRTST